MDNEIEQTEAGAAEPVADEELDFSVPEYKEDPEQKEQTTDDKPAKEEPAPEQEQEYKLDLSELDAEDMPYADILTAQAKAAGLEADKASKFVVGFTKELHDYHAKLALEESKALQKEWGKEFKAKKTQTADFMGKLFSKAGLTEEERAMFHNAPMYRVMRKIMGTMGEMKGAVAGAKVPEMTVKERRDMLIKEMVKLQGDTNGDHHARIQQIKDEINKTSPVRLF